MTGSRDPRSAEPGRRFPPTRVLGVLLLLPLAALFGRMAWGGAANLWQGDGDSPAATYVVFSAFFGLLSLGAMIAAAALVRRR